MEYRHPGKSSQTAAGVDFSIAVADRGYAWWYIDAWSDCGQHGLTIIAMLGCVFSPWYAAARRRGPVDPLQHSGLNVALYGAGGHRWALTERGAADLHRSRDALRIGPSSMGWEGDELVVRIDETTSPLPRRLRGVVRLRPGAFAEVTYTLDAKGRHHWRPIAPHCRVSVELEHPSLKWQGTGYLDCNEGQAPLEEDFLSWNWSRAHRGAETLIFYDTVWSAAASAETSGRQLALAIDADGIARPIEAPPPQDLARTPWGIRRATRADAHTHPQVLATLEDGPFYARSRIAADIAGERVEGFHESVSLQRFAARWVQCLLPVRLPRRPLAR
jgi:carotenoid 1,2-hydratase